MNIVAKSKLIFIIILFLSILSKKCYGIKTPISIELGDKSEKVISQFGDPDSKYESKEYRYSTWRYQSKGIEFDITDNGIVVAMRFFQPFNEEVDGVKIGDSSEKIWDKYGEPDKVIRVGQRLFSFKWYYDALNLCFYFEDEKVKKIEIIDYELWNKLVKPKVRAGCTPSGCMFFIPFY
jgi:hypothetical protein